MAFHRITEKLIRISASIQMAALDYESPNFHKHPSPSGEVLKSLEAAREELDKTIKFIKKGS